MKLVKLFSLIVTVALLLMFFSACETELPETCPDLEFTLNVDSDSTAYTITADFEGIENIVYDWYVNNDLVETEGLDENRNNQFDFEFAPGSYTVCILAESALCAEQLKFCQDVTIKNKKEQDCPGLKFTADKISDHKYLFTANFDGMDTLQYTWYVDGDSIESESMDKERHHKFDHEFHPGTHQICIKAETEQCEKLEFCEEIVIEEGSCPEPLFTAEPEGEFGYYFTATFDGKENIQYKWYIDGEFVDKENFEGHDTNHKLYWQFAAGTHSICIKSLASDQCDEKSFCKDITIEGNEESCPTPYFEYTHLGNNEYKFIAEFEGMHTLSSYSWYIAGELTEDEGIDHDGDNYLYSHLEPGTYEVCIKYETDDCPEGVSYCKEVIVESSDCVELSYTSVELENSYKFTADFEGRDDVTYFWKVFVNDELRGSETREAGSDDDHEFHWEFETGVVYAVCLKQDGCGDTMLCNEFSID